MRYAYVANEAERSSASRTLKNLIERSNESYVSSNEHLQRYAGVYEREYRRCLSAHSSILESMHVYRDRAKILDVKTQVMSMRLMARWFACLGASAHRGHLSRDYGHIFIDARRNRKRARQNEEVSGTDVNLCMSEYTCYMIAGVCLIIAIKYQTDDSELRFFEPEHIEYLEFVSDKVLETVNVYNALIFYRADIRKIIGLPNIPDEDKYGRRVLSRRQSRFVVEQRGYAMKIEMRVLGDLEWRVSEPVEVDFVELYAQLAASAAHDIVNDKNVAQSVFQSVLVLGQCIAVLAKIDAEWTPARYMLAPCWIVSLAIVICVLEICIEARELRESVISALKSECQCVSKRAMDKHVGNVRHRLLSNYRSVFGADCLRKNAPPPSIKRCAVSAH